MTSPEPSRSLAAHLQRLTEMMQAMDADQKAYEEWLLNVDAQANDRIAATEEQIEAMRAESDRQRAESDRQRAESDRQRAESDRQLEAMRAESDQRIETIRAESAQRFQAHRERIQVLEGPSRAASRDRKGSPRWPHPGPS